MTDVRTQGIELHQNGQRKMVEANPTPLKRYNGDNRRPTEPRRDGSRRRNRTIGEAKKHPPPCLTTPNDNRNRINSHARGGSRRRYFFTRTIPRYKLDGGAGRVTRRRAEIASRPSRNRRGLVQDSDSAATGVCARLRPRSAPPRISEPPILTRYAYHEH